MRFTVLIALSILYSCGPQATTVDAGSPPVVAASPGMVTLCKLFEQGACGVVCTPQEAQCCVPEKNLWYTLDYHVTTAILKSTGELIVCTM